MSDMTKSSGFKISNITLDIQSIQILFSTIFLFWNCQNITINNLTISDFKGRLVFAIYFYSNIEIIKLNLSSVTCRTNEKGCIMEINSASACKLTDSNFYNMSSSTSFFNAYTSNLYLERINFNTMILVSSMNNSESYTFFCEVSMIQFFDINITDYNYGFIFAEKTKLDIVYCHFFNNRDSWDKFFSKGAAIRGRILSNLNITKSSFINLRNSYEGSVIFKVM